MLVFSKWNKVIIGFSLIINGLVYLVLDEHQSFIFTKVIISSMSAANFERQNPRISKRVGY